MTPKTSTVASGALALRSRECGLYEASDLLLGDHLCEKSNTVKWICVSMPHKRIRRLKNHNVLKEIATNDPESEDIFEEDLFSTHYPKRPDDLDDVCLHDFVANYDWYGKDQNGDRKYRKLSKPRLVNHKLYDPGRSEQDYYYSLILLFVPFRDESSLLEENETAEEAFNRLLPAHDDCLISRQSVMQDRQMAPLTKTTRKMMRMKMTLGQAKSAMQDVLDINTKESDLTLHERVMMLNADQRRIYVKNHLLHQLQHEAEECSCDFKPFISGVGGTGKSFLIEAVKCLIDSIWPSMI